MKQLQTIRLLLIALAMVIAATAAPRLGIPTLTRIGILALVGVGAVALSLRQPPGDPWMRYTRALVAVAFLHLSGVVTPGAGWAGPAVFAMVHGALLAAGVAQMVLAFAGAARDEADGRDDLRAADLWILNLGVFCGIALAALALVSGEGLARAGANLLAALGFLSLFFLVAGGVRSRGPIALYSFVVLAALLFVVGMGGLRGWRAHATIRDGRRAIEAGQPRRALDAARRAAALQATLEWQGFERRIVRLERDAYLAQGRTEDALEAAARHIALSYIPRVLTGDDEHQLEFLRRYMDPGPLQPLLDEFAALEQVRRFIRLHRELDDMPEECEILHLLFLKSGRIDRLAERYDTAGLPPMRHAGSFIEALERIVANAGDEATRTRARYLLGVVRVAARQGEAARADFEAVLAVWPDDHNTLAFLERLVEARGDAVGLERLRALPRRIPIERMTGKKRGHNVDDTLWTALEAQPGAHAFAAEFRGRRELDIWPHVSVFMGEAAAPIFSAVVATDEWRAYEFEHRFEDAERSRLMMVFENDLYAERGPGLDALNRMLYFRSMLVTRR